MVFVRCYKNNLHYYGGISFAKYNYEFYIKKQEGEIYYDTTFIDFSNMLLDNCIISEKEICLACYANENRIAPLPNSVECLENHTQYICGTCGRCICIEHDKKKGMQRWKLLFLQRNKDNGAWE